MNVLLISAEAAPFAKVGGLADVVGSLPTALRRLGVDARVIMPGYGFIEHFPSNISHLFSFDFHHKNGVSEVGIYTCVYDNVPFYFVQAYPYFGNEASPYTQWDWDMPRFIYFNQVVMATAWQLNQHLGWLPDLFHANDWHTGLLPFLIAENRWQEGWSHIATMMTIHNILYQGNYAGGFLMDAGLAYRAHPALDSEYLRDNLLGIGIAYTDIVTTVSPRYAIEIQYPSHGFELTDLIRRRANDLYGILNGIDTDSFDPETDRAIISNYNADDFEEKRPANKRHLQAYAQLPIDPNKPIIGIVSRLTDQKGLDLAIPALWQLLADADAQFIVLGTGDPGLEYQLAQLQTAFADKARAFLHYDAALAQQIYAGCDLFLMPSHFEPCGIGQMLAMRYGALPVVRETGGLADTVANYDNEDGETGTGFVFLWETSDAVLNTLRWAIQTYSNKPEVWKRMQRRAMQLDLSWDRSAQEYAQLYEQAILKHTGEPNQ